MAITMREKDCPVDGNKYDAKVALTEALTAKNECIYRVDKSCSRNVETLAHSTTFRGSLFQLDAVRIKKST